MDNWLRPAWPAPPQVQAVTTTRQGGVSAPPYASLNLADHVGDDPAAVAENRQRLAHHLALPATPLWLQQHHGCSVARAAENGLNPHADACYSETPGEVCAVLTADCLPLLVTTRSGDAVAAIHAGWRGLAAGVIEATLAHFPPNDPLLIWLGPAIGPTAFEVGEEVREAFLRRDPGDRVAFAPSRPGHWWADLYTLARRRIAPFRPACIVGGERCTYRESEHFFSYRREGRCGRMVSLIWREG